MGLSSDVGLGVVTGEEAHRDAPCTGPSAGLSKLIWTGCYRIAGVFLDAIILHLTILGKARYLSKRLQTNPHSVILIGSIVKRFT